MIHKCIFRAIRLLFHCQYIEFLQKTGAVCNMMRSQISQLFNKLIIQKASSNEGDKKNRKRNPQRNKSKIPDCQKQMCFSWHFFCHSSNLMPAPFKEPKETRDKYFFILSKFFQFIDLRLFQDHDLQILHERDERGSLRATNNDLNR